MRALERCLMLAGVLLLGAWGAGVLDARLWQLEHGRRLFGWRSFESAPAPARPGDALGRLEIPRLGVSVLIAEGTGSRTLQRAVGHVTGTAYPGGDGNVALAGHRDTWFRPLEKVRRGDLIRIRTPGGRRLYRVTDVHVVEPWRTDLLRDPGESKLTLVTCYPFRMIGPAPRRFVVLARSLGAPRLAALPSIP